MMFTFHPLSSPTYIFVVVHAYRFELFCYQTFSRSKYATIQCEPAFVYFKLFCIKCALTNNSCVSHLAWRHSQSQILIIILLVKLPWKLQLWRVSTPVWFESHFHLNPRYTGAGWPDCSDWRCTLGCSGGHSRASAQISFPHLLMDHIC